MPTLKNLTHERFARLVAQGMGQTAAFTLIKPDAKSPEVQAHILMRTYGVADRISEIREIVDSQYAMMIGEKRDVLRRMALGEIPTKVIRKANGKVEAVFDRLGAIITDAKLAGEFAAEKVQMDIGPSIRLDFSPVSRNTTLTQGMREEIAAIEEDKPVEAQWEAVEEAVITGEERVGEPEPVEVEDGRVDGVVLDGLDDQYTNVEMPRKDVPELAEIANNNIFVQPDENKPLKFSRLPNL